MAENHRNHENDELGRLDASDAKDRKILLTVLLINLTQSAAGIALGTGLRLVGRVQRSHARIVRTSY